MSQDISQNNKRIAENTLALYFRTFITMIVGLYTGRVILQALGVDNYGINAVVGGIVGMSGLITGSVSGAISRYITYALGKGDKEQIKMMFSTAINVQIVMAIIVTIVLEIAGVWFLNSGANIPEGRMYAANWVLQCSIVITAINLISSPFSAKIIAHERMGIYAYTGIVDASLKLLISFLIMAYGGDRLVLFALLQVVVTIGMQMFYGWYCTNNFENSHYSLSLFDKSLIKEFAAYSTWNLLGNTAWVFNTQGVSMLINVFFGVTFNAARGLATTVNGAVQAFVSNFTMAFSPQITKSYASGNIEYAISLANRGTRFSWLMMYLFIVPVCLEADTILKLWLGDVPEMAATFLRLAMFESLAVQSGSSLLKLVQANGNTKRYQIEVSLVSCIVFPLSLLLFYLGAPVWIVYIVFILVYFSLSIVRYIRLKSLMAFSIRLHLKEAIFPCIVVSITSFILPISIYYYMETSMLKFLIVVSISILSTAVCCYLFGLTGNERRFFIEKIRIACNRLKK